MIDVQATKEKILGLEQLGFKVLEQNEAESGVVLVTKVDENFSRRMIVINPSAIGYGVQAPDRESRLVVTFNQVPVELIDLVVRVEVEAPQVEAAPAPKGKK